MFHTIAYKSGHIMITAQSGGETIRAKIIVPLRDKGQTVWDYRQKDCKSIQSAKLWITQQESDYNMPAFLID